MNREYSVFNSTFRLTHGWSRNDVSSKAKDKDRSIFVAVAFYPLSSFSHLPVRKSWPHTGLDVGVTWNWRGDFLEKMLVSANKV